MMSWLVVVQLGMCDCVPGSAVPVLRVARCTEEHNVENLHSYTEMPNDFTAGSVATANAAGFGRHEFGRTSIRRVRAQLRRYDMHRDDTLRGSGMAVPPIPLSASPASMDPATHQRVRHGCMRCFLFHLTTAVSTCCLDDWGTNCKVVGNDFHALSPGAAAQVAPRV